MNFGKIAFKGSVGTVVMRIYDARVAVARVTISAGS
jgi:hypothetical protein